MARALIPNSTQVPDVILDRWMAALSGAEFKVLMYVARRTYGFGKDCDRISLNQLAGGIRRRDGSRLDCGTGLSRSGVKAACNGLIAKGLLVRAANTVEDGFEPEESTYRLNLYAAMPDEGGEGEGEDVGQELAHLGQKKAYPEVGQKKARGRPEFSQGVGQKLAPQETVQETVQETAASAAGKATADSEKAGADADADLVEELVRHGVGRSVATNLAGKKPEICRRCLEYLPYAQVRTTPGAWLTAAIRGEFGPPEGYFRATSLDGGRQTGPSASDREERRAIRRAQLGDSLARLEREDPEGFAAFEAFADAERVRAGRFAERLTGRGRDDFLAALDGEAYRLEAFERWLVGEGRRSRKRVGAYRPRAEPPSDARLASVPAPTDCVLSGPDQLNRGEGEGTDGPAGPPGMLGDNRTTTMS